MTPTRTALVTGANRGMGLEACRQLARRGYHVIVKARDLAGAEAACAQVEGAMVPAVVDVASDGSVAALSERIGAELGQVDVLINNAGAMFASERSPSIPSSLFHTSLETVRLSFETNTLGALRMCKALIPGMRERGYGRVVNVSSTWGSLTVMEKGWPAYAVSKAALNAVTRLFASEVDGENVKVNSVCPGWVRTDMGGPDGDRIRNGRPIAVAGDTRRDRPRPACRGHASMLVVAYWPAG